MSVLRLLVVFVRIGALKEMEYRSNFFVQLFQSLLGLGTSLAGLGVILSHTRRLGGWRPAELLAVLGIYFLVGGVIGMVIQPGMQRLMEDVRQGSLDFTIIKPEDSQVLVSLQQVEIWKLLDVFLGIGVLIVALVRLGHTVGPAQVAMFAVAIAAGAGMVYSVWLMLATCCFWFVRLENILVVFQSMYEAGRWPVGIYPPWLRASLTFLVPVAFAITVPAEALVGRLNLMTLLGAVVLAAALLSVSRWFWSIGIRHYSGASA